MERKIYVIDDDSDDQELFLSAIEKAGNTHGLLQFTNGYKALAQLQTDDELPCIIFLDLNMPMIHGEELLAEIKGNKALKDIPVVILSTSSNAQTVERLKATGALEFFTKPSTFRELVSIIQIALTMIKH